MSWQRLRELIGEGDHDCDDCRRHWQDVKGAIVADAVAARRRWWQR